MKSISCHLKVSIYLFVCIFLVFSACLPVHAADRKAGKTAETERFVSIDFSNVDISVLIKFISELTGKNFVVDRRVKGKVTIISPSKISVREAFKVFESVLEVYGFATVETGELIKIVPSISARTKSIETKLKEEFGAPDDKIVTQLIPMEYADPNEIKRLFAPLISKNSVVLAYPPTNMLIVTDVYSNIKRLLRILKVIDITGIGQELSVIPLEYADATKFAKLLSTVFKTAVKKKGATGIAVKFVADERTNTIVVLASKDETEKIKRLIELLDKKTPRGKGNIHVYYLQNANAEELAKVLKDIPSKEAKGAAKGRAPVISKEVKIVADKATNSLIIMAKKEDFNVLEEVIKKLDIPRAMVYIESLIMEVNVDKDFKLGVQWQAGGKTEIGSKNAAVGGGFMPEVPIFTTPITALPSPQGFALGVFSELITIGSGSSQITFPNLGAIVQAYKKDKDVHILSTPQILTTDNEEASIYVGKNIPYVTRLDTTDTGTDYTNYEYKDVGITLKITPQISTDRLVRLNISQEVNQLESTTDFRPTTLKRTIDTTVIVKDKNTVVIGGLIDDSFTKITYKVPCLGDIPLMGLLFKSTSKDSGKTNLFVFLTPHVIQNPAEAKEIYKEKKEDIDKVKEGQIKLYQENTGNNGRKPEDMQLSDLGYQYLLSAEYDKAKTYFEKALEINPDNPYALLNLGVVYEVEGNVSAAAKMYERVISLNPKEKAAFSTDPLKKDHTLSDLARDNLENLKPKTDMKPKGD